MTTVEVTTDAFVWPKQGTKFTAKRGEADAWNPVGYWEIMEKDEDGDYFRLFDDEVIVLPDPRHRGFYDPNHPGELEPDAYDRMSYKYDDHGRHLLHTGME